MSAFLALGGQGHPPLQGIIMKIKYVAIFLAIPIALLFFLLLLLPYLVTLDRFKGMVEAQLSQSLGREVSIRELRLTPLSALGVEARGLSVANIKAFGANPFLEAEGVRVKLKALPLIWGRVEIERVLISHPRLIIHRNRQGLWNYADLARPSPTPSPSSKGLGRGKEKSIPLPRDLTISAGKFTLLDERQSKAPFHLENIEIRLSQDTPSSPIRFQSIASLPREAEVELTGRAIPQRESLDLRGLELDARTKVKNLDLSIFSPYLGPNFQGIQKGENVLSNMEARVLYQNQVLRLEDLRFSLFEGKGKGGIELDFKPPVPMASLTFHIEGSQVESLVKAILATKWGLSGVLSMEANLRLRGLNADQIKRGAQGRGSFLIQNGRFLGFKPVEQVAELLARLPGPASRVRLDEFQELSGHFTLDKGYLWTRDLSLKRPDLDVRANGRYGLLDEGLDFEVTLNSSQVSLEARVMGTTSKPLVLLKAGKIKGRVEAELERALKGERGGTRLKLKELLKDLFK